VLPPSPSGLSLNWDLAAPAKNKAADKKTA